MNKSITFIVGQRRSGTTLIREILNNHKDIEMPINDYNLISLYNDLERFNIKDKDRIYDRIFTKDYRKLEKWNLDKKLLRKQLDECHNREDVIKAIVDNFYRDNKCCLRVIKRPTYEFDYPILIKIFKNVRFIYVNRNPFAVLASRKYYPDGDANWTDKNRNPLKIMIMKWIVSNSIYMKILQENEYPIIKVNYDEYVKNPKTETKRLCEFLNVEYDKNILEQYGEIYQTSIHKWKKTLTNDEIRYIRKIFKELKNAVR